MQADVGAIIARRALSLVGTPFRLHGRQAVSGLDCVGVLAEALAAAGCPASVPADYSLQGHYVDRISALFARDDFSALTGGTLVQGDILMSATSQRQVHFAIVVPSGAVHAHAGLRRVVLSPLPLPWPVIGHWRYLGD